MITVSILINGQPLYTRSAFRLEGKQGEVCKYKCDDGSIITHNYDDGAVELGHKLLNTIKELKRWKDEKSFTTMFVCKKWNKK